MARRVEPVRYGNTASVGKETYECGFLVKDPWGKPCSEFNLKVQLQDLTCGGCPYCTLAESNWSGFDQEVDDVVPLAHKPRGQPVNEGQDRIDEEMRFRVTEIWVSTGEAETRLRWESVKGVQVVQEAEGINLQGPGEDEIKDQQRLDPKLAWVVWWRETGEETTEGEVFMGNSRSKYYWVNREVFVLERGIMWRKGEEGKSARRVIPKKFREQVVKLCHDPPWRDIRALKGPSRR